MAKMNVWGVITLLFMFKGMAECQRAPSLIPPLLRLDFVTLTQQQLQLLLPSYKQEQINRDNQTKRFIQLNDSLQNLNICNRTNRQEVSRMIQTVLAREAELLFLVVFDLVRSTGLIITSLLSIVQLGFTPPQCAGQQGR